MAVFATLVARLRADTEEFDAKIEKSTRYIERVSAAMAHKIDTAQIERAGNVYERLGLIAELTAQRLAKLNKSVGMTPDIDPASYQAWLIGGEKYYAERALIAKEGAKAERLAWREEMNKLGPAYGIGGVAGFSAIQKLRGQVLPDANLGGFMQQVTKAWIAIGFVRAAVESLTKAEVSAEWNKIGRGEQSGWAGLSRDVRQAGYSMAYTAMEFLKGIPVLGFAARGVEDFSDTYITGMKAVRANIAAAEQAIPQMTAEYERRKSVRRGIEQAGGITVRQFEREQLLANAASGPGGGIYAQQRLQAMFDLEDGMLEILKQKRELEESGLKNYDDLLVTLGEIAQGYLNRNTRTLETIAHEEELAEITERRAKEEAVFAEALRNEADAIDAISDALETEFQEALDFEAEAIDNITAAVAKEAALKEQLATPWERMRDAIAEAKDVFGGGEWFDRARRKAIHDFAQTLPGRITGTGEATAEWRRLPPIGLAIGQSDIQNRMASSLEQIEKHTADLAGAWSEY